ncbi:ornithine aminomutase subunit alpha [Thermosediminibacter oceani]|uniref:D-ornithine 4,5-aminomutase S subunit n=1 Tax=Thermosediminibacter oceani (strain ATCC BAA-1034 / DSM 16646 / JW/IW-1228P) TaxID=555079 RepID=D9RY11_THEOJ|nr:ornithine aminomutase subunit alpha [Thermosediminibacter oceani]ADL08235.1 D-ornithine 4,5-aminomutase S subunit [Thermosediminibacter oceani DSM 16646]
MQRKDDFETRRQHLAHLSEEELEKRFWELTEKIVEPLIELARTHTSPSIERSVLLRMGFDSLTAKAIVEKCVEKGLLGKGAGHVVLKYALYKNIPIKEAGERLAKGDGWDEIEQAMAVKISAASAGEVV